MRLRRYLFVVIFLVLGANSAAKDAERTLTLNPETNRWVQLHQTMAGWKMEIRQGRDEGKKFVLGEILAEVAVEAESNSRRYVWVCAPLVDSMKPRSFHSFVGLVVYQNAERGYQVPTRVWLVSYSEPAFLELDARSFQCENPWLPP